MEVGKKKVFLGILVPEEVKKQLWGVSESMQKYGYPVGWVRKEKFHLTLIYFGYVTSKKLDKIIQILHNEIPQNEPFEIKLGGLEAFPSNKSPRVITVKQDSRNNKLEEIYNKLKNVFKIEVGDFDGHVTLGRVKSDDFYVKRKISEMMKKVKLPEFKKYTVTHITLFESVLYNKEFVYQVLLDIG